ncbi:DUF393 domain-containing protein [Chitinibacter sp. FCG-7]|uniref:DUF393 domain-containing protein n=1 Tax=Chitinibacter mangrovi TaxID=3153927 RepID=A0AAU7FED4_9NEIS
MNNATDLHYQVFYDDACPLCRFEMLRLQRLSTPGLFAMVDISAADFDASAYGFASDFDPAALGVLLHIRRNDGVLLVGIDAIAALYRAIGRGWWTAPVQWQFARPTLAALYAWFAANRYRISAGLGFAAKPAAACSINGCSGKKLV